jgi:hypothetical protein
MSLLLFYSIMEKIEKKVDRDFQKRTKINVQKNVQDKSLGIRF